MELIELYNLVKNPLDNQTVAKIINLYSECAKRGNLYSKLVMTQVKQYHKGEHYHKDADEFYAMMFNKWKNSIVKLTKEEFVELYNRGSFGKDLIKLRNYLKTIPDVSTKKEVDNIFDSKKSDDELNRAMEKYRWTAFGEGTGWIHVCSRYVTAKKDAYPNIDHRLYLDTESIDTYKVITYFIKKCDERHLPYYFKFDEFGNRDDTIVIFSATNTLMPYIEILDEIKKEHPDIVRRAKNPPFLTGVIDGWIGYGSEPKEKIDGESISFNKKRAILIQKSIESVTKKWIMNHRSQHLSYHGKKYSLQEYFAIKAVENLLETLESRFQYNEQAVINQAKKTGQAYNPALTVQITGYSLQDLKSPNFKDSIFKILNEKFKTFIPILCNGDYKDIDNIEIKVRNNKTITFHGYELETVIEGFAKVIAKNDLTYITAIHDEIKRNCEQYGIDINNFSFDAQMSKIIKTSKNEVIDMDNLNIQNISKVINPSIMQKKMKLPNGNIISATQYLQDIMFKHLPKDGFVILSNGSIMSLFQFIEEGVMTECQQKYNGDFLKYMAKKTRGNLGVIEIETDEEIKEINPIEITDYISTSLLKRKIKLSNGSQISFEQFIQELFAPHIPSNGRIILQNGKEISVIQYIEDVLLNSCETYNGDIDKILYYTTKKNMGSINANSSSIQKMMINLKKQAKAFSQQLTSNEQKK